MVPTYDAARAVQHCDLKTAKQELARSALQDSARLTCALSDRTWPIHPRPASFSFFADTSCWKLACWHFSGYYSTNQDLRAQANQMRGDTSRTSARKK